jgi:uncharacterized lipoprotein NlpE involved in copper resistance
MEADIRLSGRTIMNKTFSFLTLIAMGLSGYNTLNAATDTSAGIEISGVYRGTLPCADCAGIETTLTLHKNGTFTLNRQYLKNRKIPVPVQTGTWNRTGAVAELFPAKTMPATANDRLCFGIVNADTLTPFDISCDPIEGSTDALVRNKRQVPKKPDE